MFPVPEPVLTECIIWIAILENLHGKQKAASKLLNIQAMKTVAWYHLGLNNRLKQKVENQC